MQKLITAIRAFGTLTLLLGLAYPLFVMVVGKTLFPYQANGSLITQEGETIGSALIAQEFTLPKYFHSRFSAVNYNAANSGNSNLAISNTKLYQETTAHLNHIRHENDLTYHHKIPADMALNSASGLDPHISLANAMLQLPRVAKHRNLPKEEIKKSIYKALDRDFFGIWGETGVNVLQLNLALDQLEGTHES